MSRLLVLLFLVTGCTAFSDAEVPADKSKDGSVGGTGGGKGGSGGSGGGFGGGGGGSAGSGGSAAGGSGGTGNAPSCADCGEASCECAPTAPTGWTHVRVVETLDGTVPACPGGYTKSAIQIGEGAVDTGCGECACGAIDVSQVGNCNAIWQWSGVCNGPPIAKTPATSGQCVQMVGSFVKIGFLGGSCPPSAPPNPPAFAKTVTLCEASTFGTGCGQDACVAVPKPPYEFGRCVVSQVDGDLACPSGFPIKRSYNVSFSDARTCSGCTCDVTSATCSGGTSKWCTDPGCTTNCPYSSVLPTNCVSTDGYLWEVFTGPSIATGGACTPSGSATSSGTVTATGARVVCCA